MMICALTTTMPFYDCDNNWILEIHDTVTVTDACNFGLKPNRPVLGCALFSTSDAINNIMYPKIIIGQSNYIDEWGYTTLVHEIKHLQCKCVWSDHD